ncbi:MAG: M14 family metallopeptidase [Actinomycetota bacterium]|nr:M14 family metallopeptidase [Actinomycetota bacterium]
MPIAFDRFYRYDDLTRILEGWAAEHPGLFELESIGKSFEGRDIWLATVTNAETGPAAEKPAFLIEANIHSAEVTGSTAALHLLNRLVTDHGSDARVTHALETRAFYVIPRLNPDGAELALADRPRFTRSSVRAWPLAAPEDGLHEEDVDGDGRILMMRLRDPNGAWKPHPDDPRMLIRREPDEAAGDGEFYRVLWEGTIKNFDGVSIKLAKPLEGLDLNRNFPADWATESEQQGAGPYPASEPETRAMVQAVVERPNITGHIAYHTFSGVHLRPYSGHDDDHFPTPDLRAYKLIGEYATKLTGYPAVSIFHEFKYDPKKVITGGADDWMYDHLGVFSWTTEFWSPQRQAGIEDYHLVEWIRDHPAEDDLKLLRWSDEQLEGKGWVDWYPFEHPQLGPVELGGWDMMNAWANAPPKFLEAEIAPHTELAIFHLLVSPRLEIHSLEVERVGDTSRLVRLVLQNTGWLPTNVTEKAKERNAVRPLEVELTLPEGARVVAGEAKTETGQLEGRVQRRSLLWWGDDDSTSDRTKLEWVVDATQGGTLGIEARHPRAGTVRREVDLGA